MKLFITGTDTHAGKTFVSTLMLEEANQAGFSTLGLKPISSGNLINNQNEDALALQKASSVKLAYELINPFRFESPTAPHIAAVQQQTTLSVNLLSEKMRDALTHSVDLCLIEGAGGWFTPLNEHETMADFVLAHDFSVILVIGIRLGCINHSLLTQRALLQDKVKVAGWVANCLDPAMLNSMETVETLKRMLSFPHLSTIEFSTRSGAPDLHHPMRML